jgi:hypothetical protein
MLVVLVRKLGAVSGAGVQHFDIAITDYVFTANWLGFIG